jgi:hypothetical protein
MGSGLFKGGYNSSCNIVEQMSPGIFDKVLDSLPEPDEMEVTLVGNFDKTKWREQAEELFPRLMLSRRLYEKDGVYKVESPSKDVASEIHKKFYESIGYSPSGIPDKRIKLNRIVWYDGESNIELNSWEVIVDNKGDGIYAQYVLNHLAQKNVRVLTRREVLKAENSN